MVAEEQGHRAWLRALLDKHYPDSDFVLSAEEKQMVESGSRFDTITDRKSFEQALRTVIASEKKTAQFYGHMAPHIDQPEVKAIFRRTGGRRRGAP